MTKSKNENVEEKTIKVLLRKISEESDEDLSMQLHNISVSPLSDPNLTYPLWLLLFNEKTPINNVIFFYKEMTKYCGVNVLITWLNDHIYHPSHKQAIKNFTQTPTKPIEPGNVTNIYVNNLRTGFATISTIQICNFVVERLFQKSRFFYTIWNFKKAEDLNYSLIPYVKTEVEISEVENWLNGQTAIQAISKQVIDTMICRKFAFTPIVKNLPATLENNPAASIFASATNAALKGPLWMIYRDSGLFRLIELYLMTDVDPIFSDMLKMYATYNAIRPTHDWQHLLDTVIFQKMAEHKYNKKIIELSAKEIEELNKFFEKEKRKITHPPEVSPEIRKLINTITSPTSSPTQQLLAYEKLLKTGETVCEHHIFKLGLMAEKLSYEKIREQVLAKFIAYDVKSSLSETYYCRVCGEKLYMRYDDSMADFETSQQYHAEESDLEFIIRTKIYEVLRQNLNFAIPPNFRDLTNQAIQVISAIGEETFRKITLTQSKSAGEKTAELTAAVILAALAYCVHLIEKFKEVTFRGTTEKQNRVAVMNAAAQLITTKYRAQIEVFTPEKIKKIFLTMFSKIAEINPKISIAVKSDFGALVLMMDPIYNMYVMIYNIAHRKNIKNQITREDVSDIFNTSVDDVIKKINQNIAAGLWIYTGLKEQTVPNYLTSPENPISLFYKSVDLMFSNSRTPQFYEAMKKIDVAMKKRLPYGQLLNQTLQIRPRNTNKHVALSNLLTLKCSRAKHWTKYVFADLGRQKRPYGYTPFVNGSENYLVNLAKIATNKLIIIEKSKITESLAEIQFLTLVDFISADGIKFSDSFGSSAEKYNKIISGTFSTILAIGGFYNFYRENCPALKNGLHEFVGDSCKQCHVTRQMLQESNLEFFNKYKNTFYAFAEQSIINNVIEIQKDVAIYGNTTIAKPKEFSEPHDLGPVLEISNKYKFAYNLLVNFGLYSYCTYDAIEKGKENPSLNAKYQTQYRADQLICQFLQAYLVVKNIGEAKIDEQIFIKTRNIFNTYKYVDNFEKINNFILRNLFTFIGTLSDAATTKVLTVLIAQNRNMSKPDQSRLRPVESVRRNLNENEQQEYEKLIEAFDQNSEALDIKSLDKLVDESADYDMLDDGSFDAEEVY